MVCRCRFSPLPWGGGSDPPPVATPLVIDDLYYVRRDVSSLRESNNWLDQQGEPHLTFFNDEDRFFK